MAIEPIAVPGLPSVRIMDICETGDQRLWFGGVDGLWLHDGRSLREIELPVAAEGVRRVRALAAAGNDLLVAMHSGVGRIRDGSDQVEPLAGLSDVQALALGSLPDGAIWLRSTAGMACWHDGVLRDEADPPGTRLTGFCVGSTHLWATDGQRIHCRPLRSARADWTQVTDWPALDLTIDGDGVLAIGREGVVRVEHGRPLQWLSRDASGHRVERGGGLLWVVRNESLWLVDPVEQTLRPASFYRSGGATSELWVQRVFRDSSGLMWIGTQFGAMRVNLCDGIDNIVIDAMADNERPGAICELQDGSWLIGTNLGRLLVAGPGGKGSWQPYGHGWQDQGGISSLLQDPQGRLWVGTRTNGLWRGDASGWRRIGSEEEMRGVRDLAWCDDALWICSNYLALRLDGGEDDVPRVVWTGRPASGLPSALDGDDPRGLWLATYRHGMQVYDRSADAFVPAALDGETVLTACVSPDGRQIVGATTHELWTVDAKTHVTQPWPSLGRSAFRDLLFDGNGTLWETRSRQLLQFDQQKIREIGPGTGAHPLGYSYRAGTRLRSGDIVFGARNGYTHIRRTASPASVERARITAFEVIDVQTGKIVRGPAGQGSIRVSPSFRVAAEVLDRSIDLPLACTVRLEPLDQEGAPLIGAGNFEAVALGRYHASVELLQVDGISAEISLGTFVVAPEPADLAPWLVGCAVVTLLGAVWWQTRRIVGKARRPALVRVLTEAGHDPDEVLDLAFVVVAAAEECLQSSGALRVSAWVRVGDHEPALLGQFGADAEPAVQCLTELSRQGPGWHSCACDGHREILIEMRGAGELRFQILLVGAPEEDERMRQAVDRALQPARAALDRSVWVDRLQAFCVNSSLSIEADLHDLRGALTVLRLGVAELSRERGGLDPVIGNLGNATEALLQAVKRLQTPRAMQLELADPLAILREVIDACTALAATRGIRISLHAPTTVRGAQLDQVWFRRALENVVGNALKYSDDGGAVDVQLLDDGDVLQVRIEDSGPGIDADERSRLFLPGVVGKAQPRNGEGKTGIGLWVSRQAIRAMGGQMWIESRSGGGTRVVLQLSRLDQQPPASPGGQAAGASRRGSGTNS